MESHPKTVRKRDDIRNSDNDADQHAKWRSENARYRKADHADNDGVQYLSDKESAESFVRKANIADETVCAVNGTKGIHDLFCLRSKQFFARQ